MNQNITNNYIIDNLLKKKWNLIKKQDVANIKWDTNISSLNKVIHYLAYHSQNDLLDMIENNVFKYVYDQKNSEGDTILHIAAKNKNLYLMDKMINYDKKLLYVVNHSTMAPLFYIIDDIVFLKKIIENHNIIDHVIRHTDTLTSYFIQKNDYEMVNLLVQKIDFENSRILFDITVSSIPNQLELIKKAINRGVDVNGLTKDLFSPLIISVNVKKHDIAEFLIKSGADINYSGFDNYYNPLSLAIINSDIKMINILLDNNIDLTKKNYALCTPVHDLFEMKLKIPIDIKKKILSRVNDINAANNSMNSILNLIVIYDDWTQYKKILKTKQMDIFLKNKNGDYPLKYIEKNMREQFMDMIYESYIFVLKNKTKAEWKDKMDIKIADKLKKNQELSSDEIGYIKLKIKNGRSYPEIKVKSPILLPVTKPSYYSLFIPKQITYMCSIMYIIEKYSNVFIPVQYSKVDKKKIIENVEKKNYSNNIKESIYYVINMCQDGKYSHNNIVWSYTNEYFISPELKKCIKDTIKKRPGIRYLIFKLTIIIPDDNLHMNIIIYDLEKKCVERFDPLGKIYFMDTDTMDEILKKTFLEIDKNITYLSPSMILNDISFQIYSDERNPMLKVVGDPGGYCIAWCFWYLELRLMNPDKDIKKMITACIKYINKSNTYIKQFIRNYSNHLNRKKIEIFKKNEIDKIFWYSEHLTESNNNKICKYIDYKISNI